MRVLGDGFVVVGGFGSLHATVIEKDITIVRNLVSNNVGSATLKFRDGVAEADWKGSEAMRAEKRVESG
jgi:hypothetical protein